MLKKPLTDPQLNRKGNTMNKVIQYPDDREKQIRRFCNFTPLPDLCLAIARFEKAIREYKETESEKSENN